MLESSGKKFKFKNKLFLFDPTTISLCLSLFPWADYRQTKCGVKVDVLLDQSDYMPSFITVTEAKIHDSAISKTLDLIPGPIIAADRGYLDFEQFSRWNKSKIFFVSRMKDNICYKTVIHGCGAHVSYVRSEDEIVLTGIKTKFKYPKKLRLVTIWNEDKMKWSFSVMSAMLRLNLFTYRPLPEWLDRPYETPPAVPEQRLIFD